MLNVIKGKRNILIIEVIKLNELKDSEIAKNQLKCGHLYCDLCLQTYIDSRIKKIKIPYLRCIYYKCNYKLSDDEIDRIMRNIEMFTLHFESFKSQRYILTNPKLKLCPFPDCRFYIEKNNNYYISICGRGHRCCYRCLEQHEERDCEEEELGKNFILWKEGKTVRRCPKCRFYNEKKKGINYLECSECKYKFCFICNEEYSEEHYKNGKCREITVIQPKINGCCSCCCISECENTDWNCEFIALYILLSILWFIGFVLFEFVGLPILLTYYIVTEYAYFEDFSDIVSYYYGKAYVVIFGATSLCIGLLFQGVFSCVLSVVFCVLFFVPRFNPFYLVWSHLREEQMKEEKENEN